MNTVLHFVVRALQAMVFIGLAGSWLSQVPHLPA
jgi:F0F1-type ATP synthase membrane subunit a